MLSDRWFYSTPWGEMERLLREMNEVFPFRSRGTRRAVDFPVINMWSNEEQVILTAELPGIDPNDLNINAIEDMISIQGKREIPASKEEKIIYHRQERSTGNFRRSFQLPYKINPDKVEAKYEKGILSITLPRLEADKPTKISVSVS